MKLNGVAVIANAGVALVAGCGSGASKTNAPPTTPSQTPPPPTTHKAKPKTAHHAEASTTTRAHGPVLAWIRRLQRDLTKLHFYSGPTTGVKTPATKTAIIRFQHAAHLKPDGLWGARSQAALDKMLHRS